MNRTTFLRTLGLGLPASCWSVGPVQAAEERPPAAGTPVFNVRNLGARGDGATLDTAALQRALDAAAAAGGGVVLLPPGRYLSGTLELRSHVTLHLMAGATLLGSPNLADYPERVPALRSYTDNYTRRSLLYGEDLEQVTLEGRGVIDGQGGAFSGPYLRRPYLIRMINCRDVLVRDLALRDSPMWVQHYLGCGGVRIEGLTVRSHVNHNNDGLDLDGCENVRVAHCDISSGDDAIVLKSTLDRPCRNVVVSHCLLSSHCNAFKLGTESNGGFRHIALDHCILYDTRLSGVALELVDGGVFEDVAVTNVLQHRVNNPLFIRLGNRARPFRRDQARPGQGSLRGVQIRGLRATGANAVGCALAGLPGAPIREVRLEDVDLEFAGGGTPADAAHEPDELAEAYPEYSMFGTLPAWGFFCRHAEGVSLANVRLRTVRPDARPAIAAQDVRDLSITGWHPHPGETVPPLRLQQARGVLIERPPGWPSGEPFADLRGGGNRSVREMTHAVRDLTQPGA